MKVCVKNTKQDSAVTTGHWHRVREDQHYYITVKDYTRVTLGIFKLKSSIAGELLK